MKRTMRTEATKALMAVKGLMWGPDTNDTEQRWTVLNSSVMASTGIAAMVVNCSAMANPFITKSTTINPNSKRLWTSFITTNYTSATDQMKNTRHKTRRDGTHGRGPEEEGWLWAQPTSALSRDLFGCRNGFVLSLTLNFKLNMHFMVLYVKYDSAENEWANQGRDRRDSLLATRISSVVWHTTCVPAVVQWCRRKWQIRVSLGVNQHI